VEKFVRVSCKLPRGVSVKLGNRLVSGPFTAANEMIDRAWADFFKGTDVKSGSELTLFLEAPVSAQNELAEALAKMARELRGIE